MIKSLANYFSKIIINVLNAIKKLIESITESLNSSIGKRYFSRSKGSKKLVDVNKEMHKIIKVLSELYLLNTKNYINIKEKLIDNLESLTFIESNFKEIFDKHKNEPALKKASTILRWQITTIIKIIGKIKYDNYLREDEIEPMIKFLYESTWKIIIIFEEIFKVKCKICKKNARRIIYPPITNNYPSYEDFNDKNYEMEVIKMLREEL